MIPSLLLPAAAAAAVAVEDDDEDEDDEEEEEDGEADTGVAVAALVVAGLRFWSAKPLILSTSAVLRKLCSRSWPTSTSPR